MEYPKAVLSDADGTLVDTVRLIRHGQYETAKQYLAQHGIAQDELPDYASYETLLNQVVGGSARDTLERTVRLLYESQPHHLEGMDFEALHDMLNPVQDALAPEYIQPYEGLSEFFGRLGLLGIKLAIFTSGTPHHVVRNFGIALPELGMDELYKDTSRSDKEKLTEFENTLLEYFGIPAFTVITCDDVATHKPDPASLELAMSRLEVAPGESMVLGDHTVDMKSGINAGVEQRVGITHGFNDRKTLLTSGATDVVDSLDEIFRDRVS